MKFFYTMVFIFVSTSSAFAGQTFYNNGQTTYRTEKESFSNDYVVRDDSGRVVQRIEKEPFTDNYVIKDGNGQTIQRMEKDPFGNGYTIRSY